jgi:hypothetical protein
VSQVELTLEAIDFHSADLTLVHTAAEVEASFAAGRVGVLLAVEGGQALGNSLEVAPPCIFFGRHVSNELWRIRSLTCVCGVICHRKVLRGLHRLGVRLLTLTHTGHLKWASSCQGESIRHPHTFASSMIVAPYEC